MKDIVIVDADDGTKNVIVDNRFAVNIPTASAEDIVWIIERAVEIEPI